MKIGYRVVFCRDSGMNAYIEAPNDNVNTTDQQEKGINIYHMVTSSLGMNDLL